MFGFNLSGSAQKSKTTTDTTNSFTNTTTRNVPQWGSDLVEKGAVKKEAAVNLLGNRLVLVAAKDSTISLKIAKDFPLATTLGWVVAARFVDRIGKGIRGAPRDALIADLAPPGLRGAAFGLRQSLDTAGAFIGPLLAIGLMVLSAVLPFWYFRKRGWL